MEDAAQPLLSDDSDSNHSDASYVLEKPTDNSTKGDFIRRIYRVLTVQLFVIAGIVLSLWRYPPAEAFLKRLPILCHAVPAPCMLLLYILTSNNPRLFRQSRWTYAFLTLFSVTEAVVVVQIALLLGCETVLVSLAMMIGVTGALIGYAEMAGDRFATSMGLPIAVFSTVIVFTVCIRISENVSRIEVVLSTQLLCTVASVVYSFYIVIDVQVLALRERFSLRYSEHLAAVLYLRIDVANVLWSCVSIALSSLPFRSD